VKSSAPSVAKCSAAALCCSNLAVIAVEFATSELCKLGWHWSKEGSRRWSWKEVIVVTHHGRLTTPLPILSSFVKILDQKIVKFALLCVVTVCG
jgi:hypothetical protein